MEKFKPKKGLEGVVFDSTAISKAIPDEKSLIYRGYPVAELAENYSLEEVAYLLLHDDLPNEDNLSKFKIIEKKNREITKELLSAIKYFPKKGHAMDKVRTGVSFLGMEDPLIWDNSRKANLLKSIKLFSKIPTIVAADYRYRNHLEPIAPDPNLSFSENFFYMCFGEVPEKEIVKAFDGSLILYAEHGFNASTFTARVVVSTLSDIYSGITAAICSLKGPLHGGANEQVMHMLKEIESAENAKSWLQEKLKNKDKIMGFGHRLYRKGDSRVPTMKKFRDQVAEAKNDLKWIKLF